jgi:hypothetical protein
MPLRLGKSFGDGPEGMQTDRDLGRARETLAASRSRSRAGAERGGMIVARARVVECLACGLEADASLMEGEPRIRYEAELRQKCRAGVEWDRPPDCPNLMASASNLLSWAGSHLRLPGLPSGAGL